MRGFPQCFGEVLPGAVQRLVTTPSPEETRGKVIDLSSKGHVRRPSLFSVIVPKLSAGEPLREKHSKGGLVGPRVSLQELGHKGRGFPSPHEVA
jgi:hypothetical protein